MGKALAVEAAEAMAQWESVAAMARMRVEAAVAAAAARAAEVTAEAAVAMVAAAAKATAVEAAWAVAGLAAEVRTQRRGSQVTDRWSRFRAVPAVPAANDSPLGREP